MIHGRAITFEAAGKVGLRDIEIPEPGPGEVIVETAFSLISPGTELRCLRGEQPGSLPWPFIPGYAMAGQVAGDGRRVFARGGKPCSIPTMWGGHVSHALVDEANLFELPDSIGFEAAPAVRLMGIAHRGLIVSRPQPGEKVAVIGLGPIGFLSAQWFRTSGAEVLAVDAAPERVANAIEAGLDARLVEKAVSETVRAAFLDGADVVVDATGSTRVIGETVACAKDRPWRDLDEPGARIVIQGSYPAEIGIPYQETFLKEAAVHFPRDAQPQDFTASIAALAANPEFVRGLVSATYDPTDGPAAYDRLIHDRSAMTTLFRW